MPSIQSQICTACGGSIDAPVQGGKVRCAYCGTINIVESQGMKRPDEILCPECGASNPKNAQHCGRCGIKLEANCPKCNAVNPYGTVYCVNCGVDLQGETQRQQEELKRRQEELKRQQADQLQKQALLRQQMEEMKKRKRISRWVGSGVVLMVFVCMLSLLGVWVYGSNYSPAAQSTKTAVAMGQTATAVYNTLFQDDFSNADSGWGEYTSQYGTTGYEDGGYLIHIVTTKRILWTSPAPNTFQNDVRIEVDATKTSGEDDSSQYGVFCRYQDENNFYYLAVSSNGYAAIFDEINGKIQTISSSDGKWNDANGIKGGSETNHIRADCIGEKLALYVNGNQVATATSDTFSGGGVALTGGTFDQGGTNILFTHFYIFRP